MTKKKSKTDSDIPENQIPADGENTQKTVPQTAVQSNRGIFSKDGELVVDVFETNSHFVVSTAIAGVHINDIDIALEKDMMIIRGHRSDPHGNHEKNYFYQECYWGAFSRKIILPENIDVDKADAQMDKGILTVKIPKTSENPKENIKLS